MPRNGNPTIGALRQRAQKMGLGIEWSFANLAWVIFRESWMGPQFGKLLRIKSSVVEVASFLDDYEGRYMS